jgi:hypothetical protein
MKFHCVCTALGSAWQVGGEGLPSRDPKRHYIHMEDVFDGETKARVPRVRVFCLSQGCTK